MTPITHYTLTYHPTSLPANVTSVTLTSGTTRYQLTDTEAGLNYTITLVAINSVGPGPVYTLEIDNSESLIQLANE